MEAKKFQNFNLKFSCVKGKSKLLSMFLLHLWVNLINKLFTTKSQCLMVTIKSNCMQYPQIPNLYLTNLKKQPLLEKLDGPKRAPGLHDIEKLHNTKC